MTQNGFDVIGQEIFFDGWRVAAFGEGVPATIFDRAVEVLHDHDAEEHEEALSALKADHEQEVSSLKQEHEDDLSSVRADADVAEHELREARAKITTLRGIIHLMGGDLDA